MEKERAAHVTRKLKLKLRAYKKVGDSVNLMQLFK